MTAPTTPAVGDTPEADLLHQLVAATRQHHQTGCTWPDTCIGGDALVELTGLTRARALGLLCLALAELAAIGPALGDGHE